MAPSRPKKSPSKSPPSRPGKHGGLLLSGNPGNIGGTGRPPDAFKAMCRELACSAEQAAALILTKPDHPAFIGALKWATENGYGKPVESIEHSGPNGGPIAVQVWQFGARKVAF